MAVILTEVRWKFKAVLMCVFLMAKGVEHIFKYLLKFLLKFHYVYVLLINTYTCVQIIKTKHRVHVIIAIYIYKHVNKTPLQN